MSTFLKKMALLDGHRVAGYGRVSRIDAGVWAVTPRKWSCDWVSITHPRPYYVTVRRHLPDGCLAESVDVPLRRGIDAAVRAALEAPLIEPED